MELLSDIQQRLRKLPKRGEAIEHAVPNLDDIEQTGARILRLLERLQKEQPNKSLAHLQHGVQRLLKSIREGEAPAEPELSEPQSAPAGSAGASPARDGLKCRLQQYDQWMTRDLAEDLHRLRDVSMPTPIQLDDLPTNLRERYIGKNGKWLLRVFSKGCLWNFEPLEQF